MAAPNDTAAHEMNSTDHSPTLPTSSDTRRQIIANALVEYPNIVQNFITTFPNSPICATNIFDVCVANVTEQYGSKDAPKYIAKLSHPHKGYLAARMLILSGRAMPTMELALHDLLEQSASRLGKSLDILLPVREGCAQVTEGPQAGWALHEETAQTGLGFANDVRKMAMDDDMGVKTTPPSKLDV